MAGLAGNQSVGCLLQQGNALLDKTGLHITQSLDELKLLQSYRHDNILQVNTTSLHGMFSLSCFMNVFRSLRRKRGQVYGPIFHCEGIIARVFDADT